MLRDVGGRLPPQCCIIVSACGTVLQSDKSYLVVNMMGSDEEEEELIKEPPPENLDYKRSWKDMLKLLILPPLYFLFMVIAIIVAFFSIQALFLSYHNPVRSVRTVSVDEYHTIGIAFFPNQYATYDACEFMYADDLLNDRDYTSKMYPDQVCRYTELSFYSQSLKRNRTALVFNGPTLVKLKQSLAVHFIMDTSTRNYSAIQYMLLGYWHKMVNKSTKEQEKYLSDQEQYRPLFSVSAGFRTWVQMAYTLRSVNKEDNNISDFQVHSEVASYNDRRNLSDRDTSMVYAVFEWKGNTYEYVTEILSTTAWNTMGALAGVFITLIKAGEFTRSWIRRMRRERRKKMLKRVEIEEKHRKKMEEYLHRKMKTTLKRLTSSRNFQNELVVNS